MEPRRNKIWELEKSKPLALAIGWKVELSKRNQCIFPSGFWIVDVLEPESELLKAQVGNEGRYAP